MSPPALVIAGSIVIVAVGTVAFHQFVYEPHIAPKLEVIFENWKEKRRLRRRLLAPAVYAGSDDDELSFSASGPGNDKRDLEMKDISLPLKISGIDAGLSEATLRKRPHKGELDASSRLGASEPSFVIASLLPDARHEPVSAASRSSTPSTFSSSILATQSPLINPVVSPLIDPSQHSDLADSILNSPNELSFAVLSPAHSITHISPRAPVISMPPVAISPSNPIESADSEDDEEDNRPLAAFSPRREQNIDYPVLAPSIQVARSSSSSPTGGSVYESFAPSPVAPLSPSAPAQLLPHEQDVLPLPRSNSFLSPGQRTPQSTTSWSDAGMSENDDEPDVLVGSDVESWANVSDVSRGSRRLRF